MGTLPFHLVVGLLEWLIASGRDLGDLNKKGKFVRDGEVSTSLEIARKQKWPEMVLVLEKFVANPVQTRHEVRVKLRFPDALAAEVFALTVFLCDDLLHLNPNASNQAAAAFRFFTKRMPMELQMVLCRRVVGSAKNSILRKDSEAAFKSLARFLLSQPQ